MKTIMTCSILALSVVISHAQWDIHKLSDPTIDGSLAEWQEIPPIILSPNSSIPGVSAEGLAPFDAINDLVVNLKFGWNDDGLFAAIEWRDDVIDTEEVHSRDDAMWQHPDGQLRDGMYYSDNMVIRIYDGDGYYYSNWLAPIVAYPMQWQLLRLGPRGTALTETDLPRVVARQLEPGKVRVEVFWSWDLLHFKPTVNKAVKIRIIVTDADQPSLSFESKERNVKYLHAYQDFRFRN